ncbi:PQQ-dependent sugar dehydrogenase [Beijerinckia sp. L45]|uniref:PQQ-dependent sugar dehydrogenase n=1 Tax=Beijerinckia sp. L45 TaxID=1641855 RepID=UPI00131C9291|nr:PQQ-dependent sugar dehydrogenase [Beijerinckia sp. L45]
MSNRVKRRALGATASGLLLVAAQFAVSPAPAQTAKDASPKACTGGDVGITLPAGFCASLFADKLGHVRQMVVTPDGVLYANTWSGIYYNNDTPHEGGFLIALKDTRGTGQADTIARFGETVASGGHGGTGIALYKKGLFAEIDDRIVRYALKGGEIAPSSQPQTVVSDLPITGDHPMHPLIIDAKGDLFTDLGSATNACQDQNRMTQSVGHTPCTELETRGGIWRYDANKTGQHFSPKERYATGLRNGEGFSFDASGHLFSTQHGRDQLFENWPQLYNADQGHALPAEELVEVKKGSDFGWPECYFDNDQKKLVLAPEYGGDGGKKVDVCAKKQAPVAFFPGHWAPNDMKIYNGGNFPKAYRGGAFIAFHGSWNRAPAPQGGYNIVFQPLADGKATAPYVIFADGFAGATKEPGKAAHRPTGLAFAPDGAMYISDDVGGRIWRVTYNGAADARVEAAPPPAGSTVTASGEVLPPEGIHPDAGKVVADLPTPPGATKDEVVLGSKIFHGDVDGGTCGGCHGADAAGSPIGADLTSGKWLWSDGSLAGITQTITTGVPAPKNHPGAMPAMGGTQLSPADLKAVSAYVWAVGHKS